ncbi:MAG: FKBP-type peptidyl-prolyl cis-trans isomerase [Parvularcula sp.]
MIKIFSSLMLGVATLTLVGCGKKTEVKEDGADTVAAVAPDTAEAADDVKITIPEPPENPIYEINAEKSAAYLAENGKRDGVRTLEDGLQIETTQQGEGTPPKDGDYIRFHYVGRVPDGRIFDDSHVLKEPLVVPSITEIPIPGVPEALAQMKPGENATISVPPELAFGRDGVRGLIEPNQVLIFDLELVEVVPEEMTERRAEIDAQQKALLEKARAEAEAQQKEAEAALQKLASENLAASTKFLQEISTHPGVVKTKSGLEYEILEDGGEGETPDPWDTVKVHYHGTLPDGTVFDSSVERGEPIEFELNRVISGWTEGVGLMNKGDKYRLYIPPQLGYGERGTPGGPIGPNQALVFDVELLDIIEGEKPDTE